MRRAALVFIILTIFPQAAYAATKIPDQGKALTRREVDKDKDGKPEKIILSEKGKTVEVEHLDKETGKVFRRDYYNSKEQVARRTYDRNKDGKTDEYWQFIQGGRDFVLKEYDRNNDGKIDKRVFSRWDAKKRMTVPQGTRLTYVAMPGYKSVWREEDNDFDGKIDVYRGKEVKGAPSRLGLAIDPNPALPEEEEKTVAKKAGKTATTKRVDRMNERFGYS